MKAKKGDFTLVYNDTTEAYAAVLTEGQHEMLQIMLKALGEIHIVENLKVKYKKTNKKLILDSPLKDWDQPTSTKENPEEYSILEKKSLHREMD